MPSLLSDLLETISDSEIFHSDQKGSYLYKSTWFYELAIFSEKEKFTGYLNIFPPLSKEEKNILQSATQMGLDSFHYWTPMARILNTEETSVVYFLDAEFHTHLKIEGSLQAISGFFQNLESKHIDLTEISIHSVQKLREKYF